MSSWASFSYQVKKRKEGAGNDDRGSTSSAVTTKRAKDEKGSLTPSSSFLGLKAELAGRKGERDGPSSSTSTEGYLSKKERKLPAHLRPAPDVLARSARHDQKHSKTTTSTWANTPSSQLDAARLNLERKAAMYEKLKRGGTGGLTEQSFQDSLIDWDRKEYDEPISGGSGESSDDEEEGGDARINSDEDPMTEYEDDLGRMRRVRRSQVPRSALRAKQQREEDELDEGMVSYGAATSFPVFKPDANRRAEAERANGYAQQRSDHFDADFEKRYRGAGFYQFSQDEATRREQMEALRADREETERARQDQSADPEARTLTAPERRWEERRRLVNAKRAEIEEKKRKLFGGPDGPSDVDSM